MKDILPEGVYNAIATHITRRAQQAPEGWESGSDEEDTLTGDLGATLRTPRARTVITNGEKWSWRMTYKKFRGRGDHADEKKMGADGILQIEVTRGSEVRFKGLLFQAKKAGRFNGNLDSQVKQMEELAPGGSALFEYGPKSYRAIAGRDYLAHVSPGRGRARSIRARLQPLGGFLAQDFLSCTHGLRGMHFDAARGLLFERDGTAHELFLLHRITIQAHRIV
jgi:hypothetical protein